MCHCPLLYGEGGVAVAWPEVAMGVIGVAVASVEGSEVGIASEVGDVVGMELAGFVVIEGNSGLGGGSVVVQSWDADVVDAGEDIAEDTVVGLVGLTMLMVTSTVLTGSVTSIVFVSVLGASVSCNIIVDKTTSVVGAGVVAEAVIVVVLSCVRIIVDCPIETPDDEAAAKPELPSTATTEYEARLAIGVCDWECKGRVCESAERERIRRDEGSIERIAQVERVNSGDDCYFRGDREV